MSAGLSRAVQAGRLGSIAQGCYLKLFKAKGPPERQRRQRKPAANTRGPTHFQFERRASTPSNRSRTPEGKKAGYPVKETREVTIRFDRREVAGRHFRGLLGTKTP